MLGDPKELIKAKYERNGWPAQTRPDIKPVGAWSMALLISFTRPRAHVVSPDGTQIAFYWDINDASDLYVMPTSGAWPSRLSFDRDLVAYWADDPPQWSPDGQWIAYTNQGHVWVISAAGGKPQKVTHFSTGGSSPRWLPDSHALLVGIRMEERSCLVLTDRQGTWPRAITSGTGHDHSASVSSDGTQIAYVHQPMDDFNRSDIMLANIQTGEIRSLTGTPKLHDHKPQWSPNNRTIAFLSERSGFHELFLIDAETGQENQLTQAGKDIVEYEWSPDGSQILCTLNNAGAFDLVLVDAGSGDIQELNAAYGVHAYPHWLSDGKTVSFEFEDAENPPDIYTMNLDSKTITQLTFSKAPVLESLKQVIPEQVSYQSFDGLEVPSFLYRPEKPNGAAIVYPHGGPTSQYILEWDAIAQYFVAKGYTWIAVNFRGSTGYGIEFERANHNVWGVDDTKDCLAAADYLSTLDWIDSKRIAIFGSSYGSYMASCSLAYDPDYRFACGVAKYGDCNIISSWTQGDQIGREDLERMMQHPTRNREAWWAGSPILKVADIQKPIFIAHGLLDDRVHPLQSEELVEGLKRHDKVFEYVTYADEGHGFLKRATKFDFYTRLERFFDWYLL
jgi:dipeptidyl aminopeptidase/acylaminoacyl peptidase